MRRLQHPAALPAGRAGLHGRRRRRAPGDHPPRRQDDPGDVLGRGPEVHDRPAQGLRRRLLRDVRAGLRAAGDARAAQRVHRRRWAPRRRSTPSTPARSPRSRTRTSAPRSSPPASRSSRAEVNLLRMGDELVVDAVVARRGPARRADRPPAPRRRLDPHQRAPSPPRQPRRDPPRRRPDHGRSRHPRHPDLRAAACPLPERWRSPERVDELATARARHDADPDDYWVWVAEKHRWLEPWHTVRSGELGDFRYFEGGRINVADNCVDRWAEDPATADRAADRVGGRARRHPHGDLRRARRRGEPAGRRPGRPGRRARRRRRGLHAEPRRGVHRDPRLQPDRRDLHGALLRLRSRRRRLAAVGGPGEGRRRRRRDLPARQARRAAARPCGRRGRTPRRWSTSSWSTARAAACR